MNVRRRSLFAGVRRNTRFPHLPLRCRAALEWHRSRPAAAPIRRQHPAEVESHVPVTPRLCAAARPLPHDVPFPSKQTRLRTTPVLLLVCWLQGPILKAFGFDTGAGAPPAPRRTVAGQTQDCESFPPIQNFARHGQPGVGWIADGCMRMVQ
jgi:hypothetical protein